ncbi:MAG: 50S ribosomal protein L11 methyltransferase [Bacteroidetes bacterium]|nr:50S ribosomal protein L11 methyltransferase [Bacteroidota bacterium]
MNYIEINFTNSPELNDVILAFLSDTDFEMFEEKENGLSAYIPEDKFDEIDLNALIIQIPGSENIRFDVSLIKGRNWNKEWESNFEPVLIAKKVFIRAPFHEINNSYPYEIIIEPKMSFGTGHHSTTALMIELMLEVDLKNKSVLDMGCGSGVLAILAHKLGSGNILAVDFDEWAYENTIENCQRNNTSSIEVLKGNASVIAGRAFDVILANINRNILLADTKAYSKCLNENGILMQSGFLIEDESVLIKNAQSAGLKHVKSVHQDKWSAMLFSK